jgi:hypothetical protein
MDQGSGHAGRLAVSSVAVVSCSSCNQFQLTSASLVPRLLTFSRLPFRLALAALLSLFFYGQAYANSSVFCDRKVVLTAEEKNQLLNFSAAVKDQLQKSGNDAAIISRSGIDLDRFQIRYSHAGFVLRNSENTSWAVRQLYYGCDEEKPSIYDQGLSGFLMDHDNTSIPFVSLVFLPQPKGEEMERSAMDKKLVLNLLGPQYSANAYPFSTQFQNCNQWLLEVLAYAWGNISSSGDFRADAQKWLKENNYQPSDIDVKHRYLVWASHFVPLIHNSDHPSENIDKNLYQVSMPASVEAFVRAQEPAATRVELCLNKGRIVVHRGWEMIADDCVPGEGDEVLSAY